MIADQSGTQQIVSTEVVVRGADSGLNRMQAEEYVLSRLTRRLRHLQATPVTEVHLVWVLRAEVMAAPQ